MPLLFTVRVLGNQEYGALSFDSESNPQKEIAKYFSKRDSEEEENLEEEEKEYSTDVTRYRFSCEEDRDAASFIFGDVHDFIDYDDSKHSDIFLLTGEEYLAKFSDFVTWQFKLPVWKEWKDFPAKTAKMLEEYFIDFDFDEEENIYYELDEIAFDFNTMTATWRAGGRRGLDWAILWKQPYQIQRVVKP